MPTKAMCDMALSAAGEVADAIAARVRPTTKELWQAQGKREPRNRTLRPEPNIMTIPGRSTTAAAPRQLMAPERPAVRAGLLATSQRRTRSPISVGSGTFLEYSRSS